MARETTAAPAPQPNLWLHSFAWIVLAATFLLIVAGGNVTTKNAGLAVPDWPSTEGSYNPVQPFEGWTAKPGVRDEHGHRMIGATVGLLVVVLTAWLKLREPRPWVRWMGYAALLAVIIQGVMGGLRVTERAVWLAIVHGVFAQTFFCLTVALVAVTSPLWHTGFRRTWNGHPDSHRLDGALGWSSAALVATVLVQLVLGAMVRHVGMTWIPHVGWAMGVALALMTVSRAVYTPPQARMALSSTLVGLWVMYALQLALGLGTLIITANMIRPEPDSLHQAIVPTIHVAVGAAILGLSAWLAVWAHGLPASETQQLEGTLEGAVA